MLSIWNDTVKLPEFSKFSGNKKTDVLIIGGGIAGILTAYKLKMAGIDSIVLEANKICGGVTSNTTAKITAQHGLIYNKLINEFGSAKAKLYLEANLNALNEYKELSENIDCDFKEADSYVYTLKNLKKLEKEINALEKIGYSAELVKDTELPFNVLGAVKFSSQGMFNPLKLLKEIATDLKIYENTAVVELDGMSAVTEKGKVKAKKIIVTTHFPIFNKHGSYFVKMYQKRSSVSAFKTDKSIKDMYIDESEKGLSFRTANGLLLIGSESTRTGKKNAAWEQVDNFANKYYSTAKKVYSWATQDCITLDGVPYIGNYSANTPDLYVATGFNKWGMTSSLVAANLLRDKIIGKENSYEELFSPSRHIVRKQLLFNGLNTIADFAIPTLKRCPHLGCALIWNSKERSWDCPCHGSRFSGKGKLLDGPANRDIEIK